MKSLFTSFFTSIIVYFYLKYLHCDKNNSEDVRNSMDMKNIMDIRTSIDIYTYNIPIWEVSSYIYKPDGKTESFRLK
jgi:hypothetical protein